MSSGRPHAPEREHPCGAAVVTVCCCGGARNACMPRMRPCSTAGTCARCDLSLCGADGQASGFRRCSTPMVRAQAPLLRGHAACQAARHAAVAPCRAPPSAAVPSKALTLALESCRAGARLARRAVSSATPPHVQEPGGLAGAAATLPAGDSARGGCGAGRVEMCLPAEFDSEMAGVGTCRRIQARLLPYPSRNLQCACMPACMRHRNTGMQQHVSLHALSVRGERAALYCA